MRDKHELQVTFWRRFAQQAALSRHIWSVAGHCRMLWRVGTGSPGLSQVDCRLDQPVSAHLTAVDIGWDTSADATLGWFVAPWASRSLGGRLTFESDMIAIYH